MSRERFWGRMLRLADITGKSVHLVSEKPEGFARQSIVGKNNKIEYTNSKLSSVIIDIQGDDNTIEIMENCVVSNVRFYIRGDHHQILIEKGCRFGGGGVWFEDSHCALTIGENSTFEEVQFALTEHYSRITIGQDCMFAYDIDIRTGDSHSIIAKETNERINYAEDIMIGNHVWIAAHCILLKGTVISDDSVVATGAIVTGKFKAGGLLLGGNPARILKEGITWARERTYRTKPRPEIKA